MAEEKTAEERQREIELALARGESVLLDSDEIITDSPKPEEIKEEPEKIKETEPVKEEVIPNSSLNKHYIPIPQYQDEKNEWKEEKEDLTHQIEELTAKYDQAANDGKKFSEFELKEYFQKYGIPAEQQPAVTEMLSLAAKQHKIPDEVTSEISTMKTKLAEFEDSKRFDSDWRGFASDFVKQYPNATYAQLEKAKEAMDILSHHEEKYLDKEMDYIAFREKEVFDEIFAQPVKKGFESRSQNAYTFHEQPKTKLDTESMSPAQIAEREKQIDEEVRQWEKDKRTDSQGRQLI